MDTPASAHAKHHPWYRPKPWWQFEIDTNQIALDFAVIWFTDLPAAELHAGIACVRLNCGLSWDASEYGTDDDEEGYYQFSGEYYGPEPALPQKIRERIARLAGPAIWHRHCMLLHDRVGIDLALTLDHKESWFEAHCLLGPIDASAIRMKKLG